MKVATIRVRDERRVGLVDEKRGMVAAFDLPLAKAKEGVLALVEREAKPDPLSPTPLEEVVLEAPAPRPRQHLLRRQELSRAREEFSASGFDSSAASGAAPEHPIIFSKVPECVVPGKAVVRIDPSVSQAIDYEAELAVIIGSGGRGIKPAHAMNHVWGSIIVNDVTARDLQGRHSQWLIGKSQDTFCPMGPCAVSRDEINLSDTEIRCWINGELRQNANTRDLVFDVPTIIATISAGITLRPGDIIATGTPAGVGIGFKPPKYLAHGDVARIEISGYRRVGERVPGDGKMSGATLGRIALEIDGDGPPIVFNPWPRGHVELVPAAPRSAERLSLHPPRPARRGPLSPSLRRDLNRRARLRRARHPGPCRGRSRASHRTLDGDAGRIAGRGVCAPETVLSLTLFGPIGEPNEAMRERLRDRARLVRREGMLAGTDAIAAAALSAATKSANPVVAAYVRESHLRQDTEGFAQSCEALAAAQAPDLRGVRCPVLLVTGEDDAVAPPLAAQGLADKIRGAKLKVLARCGHWTPLDVGFPRNARGSRPITSGRCSIAR